MVTISWRMVSRSSMKSTSGLDDEEINDAMGEAYRFFAGQAQYQRRINFLSRASWPFTFLYISW